MEKTVDLQNMVRRLDELSSKDAIRECVYRIERGMDRIDIDFLRSAFHDDAKVQWLTPEPVPVEEWLGNFGHIKNMTRQAQHMIGNILIDLQGDTANVESYELTRHLTLMGEDWKDLIYSARYLDRFSRRDGEWKIDFRIKIMDWMRIMEGSDPAWDNTPIKGSRDSEDISYKMFGAKIFSGMSDRPVA